MNPTQFLSFLDFLIKRDGVAGLHSRAGMIVARKENGTVNYLVNGKPFSREQVEAKVRRFRMVTA